MSNITDVINIPRETTLQAIVEAEQQRNAYLAALAAEAAGNVITSYAAIQRIVRQGLAPQFFQIGDQIIVPWTDTSTGETYQVPLDIVHFGNVTLKDGEVVPGMFLQWHFATPYGVQFDQSEALYVVKDTELPAGAYTFNIPTTWSKATAGDYTFTLTKPVPVGGQIAGLIRLADVLPSSWTIQTYADSATTEQIESVQVTAGNTGTSLGQLIPAGSEQLNSIHRVGYGYNRWSQSAIRQWLNSDKDKGQWWKPQNAYDRPPEQLAGKPGFLAGFEAEFLDVIGEIKVTTALNTVTDAAAGATEDTYDKVFLPSLEQLYVVPQLKGAEGNYWEYWKRATGATAPQAQYGTYPERITYAIEAQRSAQSVRARSAYRGYGCSAWCVGASGYVTYNYACNALRCDPACVMY